MNTLHLSIIIGVGIVSISIVVILMVTQFSSHSDETGITIIKLKDDYGVGEPISFFADIKNPVQNNLYPKAAIVNEQNQVTWSSDDLPPNGNTGNTREYLVQESSENVPIINQTGKYTLIVSYGDKKVQKDFTITELVNNNSTLNFYGLYDGIDEETGVAKFANQTYFLMTQHKTPSDMITPNDVTIRFHNVSFIIHGCGKCLTVPTVFNPQNSVTVQFPDQTNETLVIRANMWLTVGPPIDFHEYFPNGTKIFPNGTRGIWSPTLYKEQIVTALSEHMNPQAGITVTHDSVKFLVSTS